MLHHMLFLAARGGGVVGETENVPALVEFIFLWGETDRQTEVSKLINNSR